MFSCLRSTVELVCTCINIVVEFHTDNVDVDVAV